MNASDSDDDSYNERTALVPSENPVVPSYRPDPDLNPPNDTASKRVKVFIYYTAPSHVSRQRGRQTKGGLSSVVKA